MNIIPISPRQKALADIAVVGSVYGVGLKDILSDYRGRQVCKARHAAMWLIWWKYGWSLPKVGRLFGRDHTTVMSGIGSHMLRAGLKYRWLDSYTAYRRAANRRRALAYKRAA